MTSMCHHTSSGLFYKNMDPSGEDSTFNSKSFKSPTVILPPESQDFNYE